MSLAPKNKHGVYEAQDVLALSHKRGVPLAEIRVALTPDGYRAAHAFSFHTGNWWGHGSPITDHDKPHLAKHDAIEAEASRLRTKLTAARLEPAMDPERTKILAWLDSLTPDQADLFGAAA